MKQFRGLFSFVEKEVGEMLIQKHSREGIGRIVTALVELEKLNGVRIHPEEMAEAVKSALDIPKEDARKNAAWYLDVYACEREQISENSQEEGDK